jgi:hypothetical protein
VTTGDKVRRAFGLDAVAEAPRRAVAAALDGGDRGEALLGDEARGEAPLGDGSRGVAGVRTVAGCCGRVGRAGVVA